MVWKPHVTVAAVIEQDNRFLLVEEETPRGLQFNQPAGHFEKNEDLLAAVKREVKEETQRLKETKGIVPGLAVILVGDNPASQSYVKSKGKACEAIGFYSITEIMPATISEQALLAKIDEFNHDSKILD